MNDEIRIAGEHSGELCLGPVIEYMAGLSNLFCVCQFISNSKRRAGAFGDQYIAFPEPGGILVIYLNVSLSLFPSFWAHSSNLMI